jgi:hypothetical protein
MSLIITTFVPEGIVSASDSRQSIRGEGKTPDGKNFSVDTIHSDAVTKTFLLDKQQVGISAFGQDLLKGMPMASHIKRFREESVVDADDVETIAEKLLAFFRKEFGKVDTGFHIYGYKKDGKISTPFIYHCHIGKEEVIRRNLKPDGQISYGAAWSGQIDILDGLINPVIDKDSGGKNRVVRAVAPILWDAMPIQDAVDFSVFAIRTTIDTMRFQARQKNVGGPIDVLLITPDEVRWVKQKELKIDS